MQYKYLGKLFYKIQIWSTFKNKALEIKLKNTILAVVLTTSKDKQILWVYKCSQHKGFDLIYNMTHFSIKEFWDITFWSYKIWKIWKI